MCNLYSVYANPDQMRSAFKVDRIDLGNMPPLSAVFPDQLAPVVRINEGDRELIRMRWGFPSPPNLPPHPVTNVRNLSKPYWRPWLKREHRCLVPLTSFSEYADTQPRKTPVWFALSADRPLAAFAGIWRSWRGVRGTKSDPIEGDHLLYSFLTCPPNSEVGAVHPKAMPVILTEPEELDLWLNGSVEEALSLQRPLPDGTLKVVAQGEKHDQPAA